MAYLVRRPSGTVQIRESVRLEKGPRSQVLSSFTGALNDHVLSRAERKSTRSFDREDLIAQAHRLGVGWESSINLAARSLAMSLRRGRTLDPILVGLLQANLATLPSAVLDDELREAADWLGSSDEERGAALRGLLRLSDAIVQSRGTLAPRVVEPVPTLDSRASGIR